MWLVGVLGLAAGLALMMFVPSLAAVSRGLVLFAGFHLIGGVVLGGAALLLAERKLPRRRAHGLDFGWSAAWVHGPMLAAVALLAFAVAVMAAAPTWWPAALALALLAANFFAGGLLTRASTSPSSAVLPLVDLLPTGDGVVLDAGCGAGRTCLALARGYGRAHVVAIDRFDSGYIHDGGRHLLERNLALAGLTGRVEIHAGDLLSLPLPDASMDAATSAHALDHLGPGIAQGLAELRRVLRPGGRLLLVAWVPGWTMFAIAGPIAFALTGKRRWRRLADAAGFRRLDEGRHDGHWFLLLERPLSA